MSDTINEEAKQQLRKEAEIHLQLSEQEEILSTAVKELDTLKIQMDKQKKIVDAAKKETRELERQYTRVQNELSINFRTIYEYCESSAGGRCLKLLLPGKEGEKDKKTSYDSCLSFTCPLINDKEVII